MYEPITCGTCAKCVREWAYVDGGPFEYVKNEVLKSTLMRTCGMCCDWDDEPIVVMLETGQEEMPCGGTEWVERKEDE